MTNVRRPASGERGVASVEFAIVIVVLLLFLFGTLSYGFIFSLKHNMNHAASEAARAANNAPVGSERTAAESRARDALSYEQAQTHAVIETEIVDPCDGTTAGMRCIRVSITYDYAAHPIVPPLFGIGAPDTLASEAKLIID